MNTNAVIDYSSAVKSRYEVAKTKKFSSFLLNPSPAEIKNFCLVMFENGLSKQDSEVFDSFFELTDRSNKRKQIEFFNVDKLRPICNFIRSKTETTRIVNLDLLAVLVDLDPRPFRKYYSRHKVELTDGVEHNNFLDLEYDEMEMGKKDAEFLKEFKRLT